MIHVSYLQAFLIWLGYTVVCTIGAMAGAYFGARRR